ncbi:MAG TPA: hypothetical protein VIM97_13905 [Actinomycetes bacterium]|jgi:hypothetical protein
MCCCDPSPFGTLKTAFRLLAACPQPLALDGRTIGLRTDAVGLVRLRAILFHPASSPAVQRLALVALVEQARRHRGAWVVGLAGVLLPGLRREPVGLRAERSARTCGVVLAGLLAHLDAPGACSEEIGEALLRHVVRPLASPAPDPGARPWLAAVPGGAG